MVKSSRSLPKLTFNKALKLDTQKRLHLSVDAAVIGHLVITRDQRLAYVMLAYHLLVCQWLIDIGPL